LLRFAALRPIPKCVSAVHEVVSRQCLVHLTIAACVVIFGDVPLFSIRLNVLAFAVTLFVMWGAILSSNSH
jgi:hypothetical protein